MTLISTDLYQNLLSTKEGQIADQGQDLGQGHLQGDTKGQGHHGPVIGQVIPEGQDQGQGHEGRRRKVTGDLGQGHRVEGHQRANTDHGQGQKVVGQGHTGQGHDRIRGKGGEGHGQDLALVQGESKMEILDSLL